MGKVTFLFVRHAETEANISTKNLIGGHNFGTPLSSHGQHQARVLGQYLKKERRQIDVLFSSNALRTQWTAALSFTEMGYTLPEILENSLQKKHSDDLEGLSGYTYQLTSKEGNTLPLTLDHRLLEQDAGDWEGRCRTDIYERPDVRAALDQDNWSCVSGDVRKGESQAMVASRMKSWVEEKTAEYSKRDADTTILVLTHGLSIKFLLAIELGIERSTAYSEKFNPVANTSITELTYENGQLVLPLTRRNFVASLIPQASTLVSVLPLLNLGTFPMPAAVSTSATEGSSEVQPSQGPR